MRRQFEMRAARYAAHDAVVREVAARMFGRLSCMRLAAERVLDLGCGRGPCRRALLQHFPSARWLGVDLSEAMLRAAREAGRAPGWLRLRGRGDAPMRVCASAERLPLPDACVDVVFSNLMLHWHPAPHEVIAEAARVLRTGGLLLFSSYGPDTIKELRAACLSALPGAQPMPFVDMHDLGDMMITAGFEAPVMEAEVLRLSFAGARALLAEARALGGNPRSERMRHLVSGAQARALLGTLQAQSDAQGRIGLSFEIVIGHGWKGSPRRPGVHVVAPPRPSRK